MNSGINWRRVFLFVPVAAALAALTAFGPVIMPVLRNLIVPIVALLFFIFFMLFYYVPTWKPSIRPMTARRVLWLSACVAILLIGAIWLERAKSFRGAPPWFQDIPPWFSFLTIFVPLVVIAFLMRRAQK
jgi:hypothetical protein